MRLGIRHCIFAAARLRWGHRCYPHPHSGSGTYDADKNRARIAVRNTVDLSIGQDDLIVREKQRLGVRVQVVNLNNTSALYNYLSTFYLSTFSGTLFVTPRTVTVGLRYGF